MRGRRCEGRIRELTMIDLPSWVYVWLYCCGTAADDLWNSPKNVQEHATNRTTSIVRNAYTADMIAAAAVANLWRRSSCDHRRSARSCYWTLWLLRACVAAAVSLSPVAPSPPSAQIIIKTIRGRGARGRGWRGVGGRTGAQTRTPPRVFAVAGRESIKSPRDYAIYVCIYFCPHPYPSPTPSSIYVHTQYYIHSEYTYIHMPPQSRRLQYTVIYIA